MCDIHTIFHKYFPSETGNCDWICNSFDCSAPDSSSKDVEQYTLQTCKEDYSSNFPVTICLQPGEYLSQTEFSPETFRHKDELPLKTLGVYNIPCKCKTNSTGKTSQSIKIRSTTDIWLHRLEKSAMAEHYIPDAQYPAAWNIVS